MWVAQAKSDLVFVLDDFNDSRTFVAQAQRIVPYPVSSHTWQASPEHKPQAAHYDKTYHLEQLIKQVPKHHGDFNVLEKWLGFDVGHEETWEAIRTIKEDISVISEDFLQTKIDRDLKQQTIDIHF